MRFKEFLQEQTGNQFEVKGTLKTGESVTLSAWTRMYLGAETSTYALTLMLDFDDDYERSKHSALEVEEYAPTPPSREEWDRIKTAIGLKLLTTRIENVENVFTEISQHLLKEYVKKAKKEANIQMFNKMYKGDKSADLENKLKGKK